MKTGTLIAGFALLTLGSCTKDEEIYVQRSATIAAPAPPFDSTFALSVFPNPSTDGTFNFSFALQDQRTVNVKMYNVFGALMHAFTTRYERGPHTASFILPTLPSGVYFTMWDFNGIVVTKKIIRM